MCTPEPGTTARYRSTYCLHCIFGMQKKSTSKTEVYHAYIAKNIGNAKAGAEHERTKFCTSPQITEDGTRLYFACQTKKMAKILKKPGSPRIKAETKIKFAID